MILTSRDIENLTRNEMISLLVQIDRNGIWTDRDSELHGYGPLSADDAKQALTDLITRE
jgi:hypothetical protein